MKFGFSKKPMIVKEYQLDIGTVQVFEDYMVSMFNDGVTITLEMAYQIIGIAEIHFREKDFGYISHRKNSYAIDPNIYTYIRGLENLKAFAIVSKKEIDMHNFDIEKLFYKKNMEFFIEFDNAMSWVKKRLKKRSKNKQKVQSTTKS